MNLLFVETFLWIVRLGSFSAAAEKLNTTQAAISNRIATLERELGVQLFDRDMRTVKLTPVGQQAVSKAELIVKAVSEFREAIVDPTTLKGSVSIGTIDSIVHSFLPRFVERVQERYPEIAIDLNVDTSLNIAREIIERKIDLALIMGPALDHGLVNIEIGTYSCVWVASPKYGLAGKALTLGDLTRYPLFAFSKGSVPNHGLLQQFREVGLEPPPISNSNSLATIMRLAKDGLGIAPLPRVILGEYLETGVLEILDVTPAFHPLTFHAVYADHPDSPLPSIIAQMAAEVSLSMADA